jgi:hypothetical protein
VHAVAFVFVGRLFIKEIKKPFMDCFKVIQYLMALIHFSIFIFVLTLGFAVSGNSVYSLVFFLAFDPHNYIFTAINQMTWLNMFLHIRTYRELHNGKSYEEVKLKIIKNEN